MNASYYTRRLAAAHAAATPVLPSRPIEHPWAASQITINEYLLIEAARSGDLNQFTALLKVQQVNPNCVIMGRCPLQSAAQAGHSHMVKLLLQAGADPLLLVGEELSTLHWLAFHGDLENLEVALQKVGPANLAKCKDRLGLTPLHMAAWGGSPEAVTALIQAGANAREVQMHWGRGLGLRKLTPLHFACAGRLRMLPLELGALPLLISSASSEKHVACARLLLEAGASVSARDTRLNTPLHYAAMQGDEALLRLLLNAGADARLKNLFGEDPRGIVMAHAPTVTDALFPSEASSPSSDSAASAPPPQQLQKCDCSARAECGACGRQVLTCALECGDHALVCVAAAGRRKCPVPACTSTEPHPLARCSAYRVCCNVPGCRAELLRADFEAHMLDVHLAPRQVFSRRGMEAAQPCPLFAQDPYSCTQRPQGALRAAQHALHCTAWLARCPSCGLQYQRARFSDHVCLRREVSLEPDILDEV